MIKHGGHDIVKRTYNGKDITAVYYGTQLVWTAIRSCFGSGKWASEKPWFGNEIWK